ncbi:helix-turn-helix protein [Tamaricihabitans halophyticus]|uniref:Helix-turn-helix protein n=1 Tax=Tamaricihabitans halophyticus TaxID=1262583 RepID=A0A4V2SV81_9PSEU|nr:helix-turn-helix transcriptional regulator [Tamaricihabitans halophyticus]TCP57446.1 helix-turn-helix protein [Tamaricihabitans halophyticus]
MEDPVPTLRSRQLGDALRKIIRGSGLSQKEVALRLQWDQAWLSRVLSGKRMCSDVDLAALLATCNVVGPERDRLLGLNYEARKPGLLQQFGARLPEQLHVLADLEDHATEIADFQPAMVPGLLQTSEYARALSRGSGHPEDEIDDRVAARMARQALLDRVPEVKFTFFIHELVLRLPVGGDEVMSEQLHHLLRLAVRPKIHLRVVPIAAGAHAGIVGQFKLLDFAGLRPVVYLDGETTQLFLEETAEIAAYRRILKDLAATALDRGQSKELIADLAIDLYPEQGDHNAQRRYERDLLAEEQLQQPQR